MTPYAQLPTDNPEKFIRTVGLSIEDFQHLNGKLAAYLDEQKALNLKSMGSNQWQINGINGVNQQESMAKNQWGQMGSDSID